MNMNARRALGALAAFAAASASAQYRVDMNAIDVRGVGAPVGTIEVSAGPQGGVVFKPDLKGLPPVLIQVGSAETLLDDATRIAEKMHTAGVEVRLAVWPNMVHVFPFFAPVLSEGRDGCLEIGTFIRGHTA